MKEVQQSLLWFILNSVSAGAEPCLLCNHNKSGDVSERSINYRRHSLEQNVDCQQRRDGYTGKALLLLLLLLLLLSPPLNSGLLAAGRSSSFCDPFSVSLISVLVYEYLVTVCQIQREDINSSRFGTLTLFFFPLIGPRYRFFALSFPPRYLFPRPPTTHSTASPITPATVLFFPPLCHRSLLQACGSVLPL